MKRVTTHPRRKARQQSAYARGAAQPGTKPNPQHRKRDKYGIRYEVDPKS